jgi:hypothetical protein
LIGLQSVDLEDPRMPMSRSLLVPVVVIAAAGAAVLAQPARGSKVLLLYDMEGITAADEFRKTTFAHPKEYAEGRQSLTTDVNAAIAGHEAGGATEIVVVDGHGSGKPAALVRFGALRR